MNEPQVTGDPRIEQILGYVQGLHSRLTELEQKIARYEEQLAAAANTPVVRGALAAMGIRLPERT